MPIQAPNAEIAMTASVINTVIHGAFVATATIASLPKSKL